jgi:hypothetical protein
MKFSELHEQILSIGFTALSNPLEDLLLAHLPDSYYRVWRYVWRQTIGWNRLATFTQLDEIKEATGIERGAASRALHVLHLFGLICYLPGHKGQKSHVTVLPSGFPDYSQIAFLLRALCVVEEHESNTRRGGHCNRFSNQELCSRVLQQCTANAAA